VQDSDGSQLFFDMEDISMMQGCRLKMHPATVHEDEPPSAVPDQAFEGGRFNYYNSMVDKPGLRVGLRAPTLWG
jgi:hypothetical protein